MNADDAAGPSIQVHVAGSVISVRIDAPNKVNAISPSMLQDLETVVTNPPAAPEGSVLILSGRPGIFSAGANLPDVAALGSEEWMAFLEQIQRVCDLIAELPLPTIASIDGPCIGLAAEIALACDFRIASDRATLAWPEVTVGLPCPVRQLTQYLSKPRVVDLVLTGRMVPADEALALGLLTQVTEGEGLESATAAYARSLTGRSPIAVGATKKGLVDLGGAPVSRNGSFFTASARARDSSQFRAAVNRLKPRSGDPATAPE